MTTALLGQLATCDLRALCKASATGYKHLSVVYASALDQGVVEDIAADDIRKLHSLFDIAISNGLVCWVCDYIEEVCSDSYFTSSDPSEAFLLDGECVLAWCAQKIRDIRVKCSQALQAMDDLQTHCVPDSEAWLNTVKSLRFVFKALDRPRAALGSPAASESRTDMNDNIRQLQQLEDTLQALCWLQRLPSGGVVWALHHSSVADLSTALRRRRSQHPLGAPFVDDLEADAAPAQPYPFRSPAHALQSLLLYGSASAPHRSARLALLLYYLLDAKVVDSPGPFASALGLSQAAARLCHAQLLLDAAAEAPASADAGSNARRAQLRQAGELAAACADGSTPRKVVEVLSAMGEPHAALAVYRSMGEPWPSLPQALALTRARLACGLAAEAMLTVRRHLAGLPPAARPASTRALVAAAGEWALGAQGDVDMADSGAQGRDEGQRPPLQQLLDLGWDGDEEAAWLEWLSAQAATRSLAPLYLLQRGRVPEALLAYQEGWAAAGGARGDAAGCTNATAVWGPHANALEALLSAAAAQLPPPLRHLAVVRRSSGLEEEEGEDRPLPLLLTAGLPSIQRDNDPTAHVSVRQPENAGEPTPLVSLTAGWTAEGAEQVQRPATAAPSWAPLPGNLASALGVEHPGGSATVVAPVLEPGAGAQKLPEQQGVVFSYSAGTGEQSHIGFPTPGVDANRGPSRGMAVAGPVPLLFGSATPTGSGKVGTGGLQASDFDRDVLGLQPPPHAPRTAPPRLRLTAAKRMGH